MRLEAKISGNYYFPLNHVTIAILTVYPGMLLTLYE